MKTLQDYRSFTCGCSITTDDNIIIVDEKLPLTVRTELEKLETSDGNKLIFLEDQQLANGLEKILEKMIEKEKGILILVFPGNGSNYPRKLSKICKEFSNGFGVPAKRFWAPGTNPTVEVGVILPEIFLNLTVKTIVVVDDVISSGLTMQKLHQKNAWRFPAAKWLGASWISQTPQMRAESGINGYEQVGAGYVVQKTNGGKVPINSLSTLRQQPKIAKSYAESHFKNPRGFLHLIKKRK
jgi:hypothetical protein